MSNFADNDIFTKIIFPYTKAKFVSNFWEKRFCHISNRENPDLSNFLKELFSYDEADRILTNDHGKFHESIRVCKDGITIPQENLYDSDRYGNANYDIEKILTQYHNGATVILNRVHLDSKLLKDLCNNLSICLSSRVSANTYLTPPNSNGFHVHADLHDVILLQIKGEKHWKLQNENEFLTSPRVRNTKSVPTSDANWSEITLKEGEALYIPRGIMHEGISTASHSLHITIGIHAYTWFDLLQDSLIKLERETNLLRKSASISLVNFEKTLAEVSKEVSNFLSDENTIKENMLKQIGQLSYENLLRGKLRRLAEPQKLNLNSKIKLKSSNEISMNSRDSEIELRFGKKALLLPKFTTKVLKLILKGESFTPKQLSSSIDDKSKLVLLNRLCSEGILEVL